MKREKILSCLAAALTAVCLGFGGASCMTTGLFLSADIGPLLGGCVFCAAIICACLAFRRGGLALAAAWAAGGLLLYKEAWSQFKSLCLTALTYYHNGYGIPIPDWLKGAQAQSHLLPLLVIAAGVMTVTAWVILRKKPAALAVIPALLPLISCIVVTDTVPGTYCVALVAAGLVILLMTQPVRRRSDRDANYLTGILLPLAAAALLVLSLVVPQADYQTPALADTLTDLARRLPMLGQTTEGELVLSFGGVAEKEVDLSDAGPRVYQNRPVMEIVTNHTDTLYLRGRDYDRYDGLNWIASEDRTENYGLPEIRTNATGWVTVKTLGTYGQYYLPAYPAGTIELAGGMVENPAEDVEYTFEYRSLTLDWENQWRYVSTILATGDPVDERYLELPAQTQRRAVDILDTLSFTEDDDTLDRAQAIVKYVENSAKYDLKTDHIPENEMDFAMWFLEESETGYCVHFASAATVLLRAAGVPARYVEGYAVEVQAGQTTVVRDRMAHAWVEVYLEHLGWVMMDPTPAEETDPEETTPVTTVPGPAEQTTVPSTAATAPTAPSGGSQKEPDSQGPVAALRVVGWMAALAGLIAVQWLLRLRYKNLRLHRGKKNARALARYREAKRLAKLSALELPEELTALAEKAKFSHHTLTREELARFDAFLTDCVKALRKRPWYYRAVYRLIFAAY